MLRRTPRSTRQYTLVPPPTRFRSLPRATARSAPASTRVVTPSATPSSACTCAALPTAIARAAVACVKRKRSVLSVESPRKPPSARLFSPVAWLYTPVAVLNWPVALLETPSAIAPKAVPCELLPRASDQEPLAFERTPIAIEIGRAHV